MKTIYGKYSRAGASVWAGCAVVFFLFYLLVLAPQEKVKVRIEKRLAETERAARVAMEAAQKENKANWRTHVSSLDERLKDFVTEEKSTANLTFDIDRISSDMELDSASITAAGVEGVKEIENCDYLFARHINVTFTSSFNKFASFLNALERRRPVIFVDTFSINRSKRGDSNHKADMTLTVLVERGAKANEVDG